MGAGWQSAGEFYRSAQGAMACRLVGDRLLRHWPALPGMAVLGLGFATPYLELWRAGAARCVAMTPAQLDCVPWPDGPGCVPGCVTVGEEEALPFPDLSFDRILIVHGLEAAENARRMLREVWRVLKDDGRALVVAPNRVGLWAHFESTPFGHGQPYSPGQIGRVLAGSMFRVEARDTALYVPPYRSAVAGARLWEQGGRWIAPHLAGVTITEAVKDVYAGLPVHTVARRRLVLSRAT